VVRGRGAPDPAGAAAPLVFAFPASDAEALRRAKLFFLLSAAERFLLPPR
jgi:hypothetical protein